MWLVRAMAAIAIAGATLAATAGSASANVVGAPGSTAPACLARNVSPINTVVMAPPTPDAPPVPQVITQSSVDLKNNCGDGINVKILLEAAVLGNAFPGDSGCVHLNNGETRHFDFNADYRKTVMC